VIPGLHVDGPTISNSQRHEAKRICCRNTKYETPEVPDILI
jgi:hypothetical protein